MNAVQNLMLLPIAAVKSLSPKSKGVASSFQSHHRLPKRWTSSLQAAFKRGYNWLCSENVSHLEQPILCFRYSDITHSRLSPEDIRELSFKDALKYFGVNMQKVKVAVPNSFVSEAIQKTAFNKGLDWASPTVKHNINHLSYSTIYFDFSQNKMWVQPDCRSSYQEISLDELFELLTETKINLGGIDFTIKNNTVSANNFTATFEEVREIAESIKTSETLGMLAGHETRVYYEPNSVAAGCVELSFEDFKTLLGHLKINTKINTFEEVPF